MSVRYRFCEKETKRKGRKLLSRSVFTPCWHSQEYFSQFILHNRKARFSLTHGLRMIRTSSSSSIHPCASKPPPKLVHMVCSLFFPPIPSKGRISCASAYRLIEVIPASMQIAVRAVSLGIMGKIMHVQPSMRVPSFGPYACNKPLKGGDWDTARPATRPAFSFPGSILPCFSESDHGDARSFFRVWCEVPRRRA